MVEEEAVLVQVSGQRWEKTDKWVPLIREREGRARYRFGILVRWAVGWIGDWAGLVPCGLFFFSLFLFLFLFLISVLIQILCNFDSNQFKQIPKFSNIQHNILNQ
jgi:hypothetical protein